MRGRPLMTFRNARENVLRGLHLRFLLHLFPAFSRRRRSGFFDEHFGVHVGIPDLQQAHLCVLAHVLAIRLRHGQHGVFATPRAQAEFTRGQDDTRRQSLDVPFPGSLKGFVEIVDVKQESALRAGKAAEIRCVAIAARLHSNSSHRGL